MKCDPATPSESMTATAVKTSPFRSLTDAACGSGLGQRVILAKKFKKIVLWILVNATTVFFLR